MLRPAESMYGRSTRVGYRPAAADQNVFDLFIDVRDMTSCATIVVIP